MLRLLRMAGFGFRLSFSLNNGAPKARLLPLGLFLLNALPPLLAERALWRCFKQ
jgi:hypothetical protein